MPGGGQSTGTRWRGVQGGWEEGQSPRFGPGLGPSPRAHRPAPAPPEGASEAGGVGSSPGAPLIPEASFPHRLKGEFWGYWGELRACRIPQAYCTERADRPRVHPAEKQGPEPASQELSQSHGAHGTASRATAPRASPRPRAPLWTGAARDSETPPTLGHTPSSCRRSVPVQTGQDPAAIYKDLTGPHGAGIVTFAVRGLMTPAGNGGERITGREADAR